MDCIGCFACSFFIARAILASAYCDGDAGLAVLRARRWCLQLTQHSLKTKLDGSLAQISVYVVTDLSQQAGEISECRKVLLMSATHDDVSLIL